MAGVDLVNRHVDDGPAIEARQKLLDLLLRPARIRQRHIVVGLLRDFSYGPGVSIEAVVARA